MSETEAGPTANPLNKGGEVEMDSSTGSGSGAGPGRLTRTDSFIKGVAGHIDKEKRSPFVKHEDEPQGYAAWGLSLVFAKFVTSIPLPVVKKLKPNRLIFFGLMAYGICIAFFLGFAISGYVQSRKEEFVSLKEDAGICK